MYTSWDSFLKQAIREYYDRSWVARKGNFIALLIAAGQTSLAARPVYGRMFQTPFADRIRNEAGIATMAVGNITEIDHVNGIIAAGRADLCCLARPHLSDPYWTLRAAALQGYVGEAIAWPPPYLAGQQQLERLLRRAADGAGAI